MTQTIPERLHTCYGSGPFQKLRRHAFSYQQGVLRLRLLPTLWLAILFGRPTFVLGHRTRRVAQNNQLPSTSRGTLSLELEARPTPWELVERASRPGRIFA